jgi:hypothetical protein
MGSGQCALRGIIFYMYSYFYRLQATSSTFSPVPAIAYSWTRERVLITVSHKCELLSDAGILSLWTSAAGPAVKMGRVFQE